MKKTILVFCFLTALFYTNSAFAQVPVEEVVIRGNAQWKPWQGGGGGTGGGMSGAEPSEKDLERNSNHTQKPKTQKTKKAPGNAHTKIKSMLKFNKWLVAADWLYDKAAQLGKNMTVTMNSSHVLDYNGNVIDSNSTLTMSSFLDSGRLYFRVEITDANGNKSWAIFAGGESGQ